MSPWVLILGQVVAVFAVLGAGYGMRRRNWLTEEADQSIMAMVIRVLMPCLILHTTLGNPRLREAANVVWPLAVGIGTVALGLGVAWLVARWSGRKFGLTSERERRTFVLCVGIYNYGYIPIPLVDALWGQQSGTMGVLFVYNVAVEFGLWTLGMLALTGSVSGHTAGVPQQSAAKADVPWWRRMLNPPSLAVLAALVLNFAHVIEYVPDPVLQPAMKVLQWLGSCAIPLSLILVGATIADHFKGFGDPTLKAGHGVTAMACILRLGVLPLLFVLLAKFLPGAHGAILPAVLGGVGAGAATAPTDAWAALSGAWGVTSELRNVLVVQAAMPAAMFPIVMSKYYAGDPPTALRVVLGSSLVGLATIPMWITLGLALLR